MKNFLAKLIRWGQGRESNQRVAEKEQKLRDIERSINALEQQPFPIEENHETKRHQNHSQGESPEKDKKDIAA